MRVETLRCGNGKCFYFFGEMIFRREVEDQARAQAICGTLVLLCLPKGAIDSTPGGYFRLAPVEAKPLDWVEAGADARQTDREGRDLSDGLRVLQRYRRYVAPLEFSLPPVSCGLFSRRRREAVIIDRCADIVRRRIRKWVVAK
jgi:hypothetical protein